MIAVDVNIHEGFGGRGHTVVLEPGAKNELRLGKHRVTVFVDPAGYGSDPATPHVVVTLERRFWRKKT